MDRKRKRPRDSEEFKAKVAVEAVKGVRTLSERSSAFGALPPPRGAQGRQRKRWKDQEAFAYSSLEIAQTMGRSSLDPQTLGDILGQVHVDLSARRF